MIADLDAAKRVATRALPHYGADTDAVLTFVKYRENYVFQVDQRAPTYLAWAADRPGDETSDFVLQHVRPVVVGLAAEFVALTHHPAPIAPSPFRRHHHAPAR